MCNQPYQKDYLKLQNITKRGDITASYALLPLETSLCMAAQKGRPLLQSGHSTRTIYLYVMYGIQVFIILIAFLIEKSICTCNIMNLFYLYYMYILPCECISLFCEVYDEILLCHFIYRITTCADDVRGHPADSCLVFLTFIFLRYFFVSSPTLYDNVLV